MRRSIVFVIGIDPHKGSHTAAVLDGGEQLVGELRVERGSRQADRLFEFAAPFSRARGRSRPPAGSGACWPNNSSPPARRSSMCRRRCRRGCGCSMPAAPTRPTRTTPARRRSSRCATRGCGRSRPVDHGAVLRLLADRHHDLVAQRTQAICRLHALLCLLIAGGLPASSPRRAGRGALRSIRPVEPSRSNASGWPSSCSPTSGASTPSSPPSRTASRPPSTRRRRPSPTIHGVGPIVAAIMIGHTGDIRRFPTAGHFARYNGTAPIEASRGPTSAAPAQPPRQPTAQPRAAPRRGHPDRATRRPGRAYSSASSPKARAAKKRCARSSGASATPSTDSSSPTAAAERAGPGGQQERLQSSVTGSAP